MKTPAPSLRVIFAGTPEFALPPLRALLDEDCEIVAVLTQPDRPAGRGQRLRASPVKQLAQKHGLPVWQPASLRDPGWNGKLAALRADVMVVVAYGLMLPEQILGLPRLGCWNVHASLLPRWRGAAPIQRAIEAGDAESGVCVMRMEASLDTGPVYHCVTTAIGPQDTAGDLHDRLAALGAAALGHCIGLARRGQLPEPRPQDHALATYARKLDKAEAKLDWNQPAEVLQRRVRAFNPWPVAWCELGGQRLRIWRAEVVDGTLPCEPGRVLAGPRSLIVATAEKSLKILELQRAGGQRMSTEMFLNAHQLRTG